MYKKLIESKNLLKKFKTGKVMTHVIKGIDMEIGEGEFIAIVGPSGSGKSTLLNLLSGIETPTSGTVYFRGQSYADKSSRELAKIRNREFGIVFQNYQLFPNLKAVENVAAPAYINNEVKDPGIISKYYLKLVGLEAHMYKYPDQLSGGQKQRVAIARALVNSPSILFADEPTGNLDSITANEILYLFTKIREETGISLVIVTHDKSISNKAEKVLYLNDGYIQSYE